MQWKGRRESSNVEDARAEPSRGSGGSRGGLGLLMMIGRVFGVKGIVAVLVVGGVLWKMGLVDPGMLLGGGPAGAPQAAVSSEDQQRYQFVKVVLADTEAVWTAEFARHGKNLNPIQQCEPATLQLPAGGDGFECPVGLCQAVKAHVRISG